MHLPSFFFSHHRSFWLIWGDARFTSAPSSLPQGHSYPTASPLALAACSAFRHRGPSALWCCFSCPSHLTCVATHQRGRFSQYQFSDPIPQDGTPGSNLLDETCRCSINGDRTPSSVINAPGIPTCAGEAPDLPLRTTLCRVWDTALHHVKEQLLSAGGGGLGELPTPRSVGQRSSCAERAEALEGCWAGPSWCVRPKRRAGVCPDQAAFWRVPWARRLPLLVCTA